MEIGITVALIAAAVSLFAALVAHRLAVWREQWSRRAMACAAFRATLLESFHGLYPEPVDWPARPAEIVAVLERKFAHLQAAVQSFRPYVPFHRRHGFDRAWRLYRVGHAGSAGERQNYWQYVPHPEPFAAAAQRPAQGDLRKVQVVFRAHVARLLSFARVT